MTEYTTRKLDMQLLYVVDGRLHSRFWRFVLSCGRCWLPFAFRAIGLFCIFVKTTAFADNGLGSAKTTDNLCERRKHPGHPNGIDFGIWNSD